MYLFTWNILEPQPKDINCCMVVKNPYVTYDCFGKPSFISGCLCVPGTYISCNIHTMCKGAYCMHLLHIIKNAIYMQYAYQYQGITQSNQS